MDFFIGIVQLNRHLAIMNFSMMLILVHEINRNVEIISQEIRNKTRLSSSVFKDVSQCINYCVSFLSDSFSVRTA